MMTLRKDVEGKTETPLEIGNEVENIGGTEFIFLDGILEPKNPKFAYLSYAMTSTHWKEIDETQPYFKELKAIIDNGKSISPEHESGICEGNVYSELFRDCMGVIYLGETPDGRKIKYISHKYQSSIRIDSLSPKFIYGMEDPDITNIFHYLYSLKDRIRRVLQDTPEDVFLISIQERVKEISEKIEIQLEASLMNNKSRLKQSQRIHRELGLKRMIRFLATNQVLTDKERKYIELAEQRFVNTKTQQDLEAFKKMAKPDSIKVFIVGGTARDRFREGYKRSLSQLVRTIRAERIEPMVIPPSLYTAEETTWFSKAFYIDKNNKIYLRGFGGNRDPKTGNKRMPFGVSPEEMLEAIEKNVSAE